MLTWTPHAIDLGEVGVGEDSATQTIHITNHGDDPVTFAGGGLAEPFNVVTNCLPALQPDATCQLTVRFSPTEPGIVDAVSHSESAAGNVDVLVRGTGIGPRTWATPLGIDFHHVPVDDMSPSRPVRVTNIGKGILYFAGGGVTAPFSGNQSCASGMAPGQTCQFNYWFAPTSAGLHELDAPFYTTNGEVPVRLRGHGVAVPPLNAAVVTASAMTLDFGEVGVGSSGAPQVVEIKNSGTLALPGFTPAASSNPVFTLTHTCAGGIPAGGSCEYTIGFSPTAVGTVEAQTSTATSGGTLDVQLLGTGIGARLWYTPRALDFGRVHVGDTSPPQTVTLTNLGMAPLSGFSGGESPDPQFVVSSDCIGAFAPGATCTYTIRFTPSAEGLRTSTSNTFTNGGPMALAFSGYGLPAIEVFHDGFE